MSEWIIQEKNNIDDCWVSTQALNRIELNCRNFPFPSFCCRRHRLSLSIPKHSTRRRVRKAELIYFFSFASFRISAIDKESLAFFSPSTHRSGSRDEYKCHIELHWCCCCLDSSRRQMIKLGKYQISRIILTLLCCCHGSIKVDDDFQPSDRQSSERRWWKFSLFVGNNAKVKRISQLEKTLFLYVKEIRCAIDLSSSNEWWFKHFRVFQSLSLFHPILLVLLEDAKWNFATIFQSLFFRNNIKFLAHRCIFHVMRLRDFHHVPQSVIDQPLKFDCFDFFGL